jgi:uncharacterized protein YjbI with pentapeptide repeats
MGVYLAGVCLTGVHLIGVRLAGVHLTGVHLMGVYLTGTHLTGSHPLKHRLAILKNQLLLKHCGGARWSLAPYGHGNCVMNANTIYLTAGGAAHYRGADSATVAG